MSECIIIGSGSSLGATVTPEEPGNNGGQSDNPSGSSTAFNPMVRDILFDDTNNGWTLTDNTTIILSQSYTNYDELEITFLRKETSDNSYFTQRVSCSGMNSSLQNNRIVIFGYSEWRSFKFSDTTTLVLDGSNTGNLIIKKIVGIKYNTSFVLSSNLKSFTYTGTGGSRNTPEFNNNKTNTLTFPEIPYSFKIYSKTLDNSYYIFTDEIKWGQPYAAVSWYKGANDNGGNLLSLQYSGNSVTFGANSDAGAACNTTGIVYEVTYTINSI